MKSRSLYSVAILSLIVLAAGPVWIHAQSQPSSGETYYRVYNLGSLGGSFAAGNGINNIGAAVGESTLANQQTVRAALWLYGQKIDLGALGGPLSNSAVLWPVKNDHGEIVGVSETSTTDPNSEGGFSCSAFIPINDNHTCMAFLWSNGAMTPLPTLGGNNGFATGINNHGQAVGWTETANPDSTCVLPQRLQFEATEWGPNGGKIHALVPLPGDPDSAATAINDEGEVVGISGICGTAVGGYSAEHAVLWQNGQPIYLGRLLGGAGWNTPMAINNLGEIVGFGDVLGDTSTGILIPNFQAFSWTQGTGASQLAALPAPYNAYSEATGVNGVGQIAGVSCDPNFNCQAVLWQNGMPANLNSLVVGNSNLYLISASDINDHGEITGEACVVSNGACSGTLVSFLAVPTAEGTPAWNSSAPVTLPAALRNQIKHQIGMGAFAGRDR